MQIATCRGQIAEGNMKRTACLQTASRQPPLGWLSAQASHHSLELDLYAIVSQTMLDVTQCPASKLFAQLFIGMI